MQIKSNWSQTLIGLEKWHITLHRISQKELTHLLELIQLHLPSENGAARRPQMS